MTEFADLVLRNSAGEESRLEDYAGEVVLVTDAAAPFQPLLERYETEGLAVAAAETDDLVLIGRDGAVVARFPAGTAPDSATLAAAIERELFASE